MKPRRPSSPGGGSPGDPSRLNRVALRRSSLRFGRNTRGPVLPVGARPAIPRAPCHAGPPPGGLAPPVEDWHPVFLPRANWASPASALTRVPPPAVNRAAHRCVSVEIHAGQFSRWGLLPHAPCQPGPHREDWPHRENWASPASALTWVPPPAVHHCASLRSALRFGRNTPGPVLPVGAPPSRALSAGPPPGGLAPPGELGLPGLGAHVGSTTGCSPLRFAPFCVAFRSKYTRYSSLTRLVSRTPTGRSALTRVPPQAASGRSEASDTVASVAMA